MNEDRLNELLKQLDDSPIERELLQNLYPHLTTDRAQELRPQYEIDFIPGVQKTTPDFAFPDMKIAIYCDGFETHKYEKPFSIDRFQSTNLQLQEWIVLRFSGFQIYEFALLGDCCETSNSRKAIKSAIALRDEQQQETGKRNRSARQATAGTGKRNRSARQATAGTGKRISSYS